MDCILIDVSLYCAGVLNIVVKVRAENAVEIEIEIEIGIGV